MRVCLGIHLVVVLCCAVFALADRQLLISPRFSEMAVVPAGLLLPITFPLGLACPVLFGIVSARGGYPVRSRLLGTAAEAMLLATQILFAVTMCA